MTTLKKLEMKRADYIKTEKTKKDVEKFESQMMVASQAIETTSMEIIKLRESELYPQLIELVKGFVLFLSLFFFFPCTMDKAWAVQKFFMTFNYFYDLKVVGKDTIK